MKKITIDFRIRAQVEEVSGALLGVGRFRSPQCVVEVDLMTYDWGVIQLFRLSGSMTAPDIRDTIRQLDKRHHVR